jgi:hypothetical protein
MIVALLLNHALGGLGVIYFGTIVFKAARRYPLLRWFF